MKMSASKGKKTREELTDGFDMKNDKDMQADLKRRKQTRTAVISLIAFAVVAVVVLVLNSNLFYRNVPALNVDGHNFSVSEMNYYVRLGWNIEGAIDLATNNAVLHQRAVEEGLEISESQRANIENRIEQYRDAYAMWGFDTLNSYLAAMYGRGVNLSLLRNMMEFDALAHAYIMHFIDELQEAFTTSELEAHYMEEVDQFDRLVFRVHSFPVRPDDMPLEDAPVGTMPLAVARDAASAIFEAAEEDGEEGFLREVAPFMNEDLNEFAETTTHRDVTGIEAGVLAYGEWVMSNVRRPGDVIMHEEEYAIYVVFFVERDENRHNTTAVRHILITPEMEEVDGVMTENWEAAEARAEELLAQWRSEGATEEGFIALVQEYSADYQGEEDPGFYGGIHRNAGFVAPFRDWAVDASRRAGDVEIVETQFGYHIIFFIGEEERSLRHQLAADSLAVAMYQEWLEERMEAANVQRTFFGRLVDPNAQ